MNVKVEVERAAGLATSFDFRRGWNGAAWHRLFLSSFLTLSAVSISILIRFQFITQFNIHITQLAFYPFSTVISIDFLQFVAPHSHQPGLVQL